MSDDPEIARLLVSIETIVADSARKWDDHLKEHRESEIRNRERDSKLDEFMGDAKGKFDAGNKQFQSLKASTPKPRTLATEWPKLLGLVGAAFGLWRTLATIDYVDKAVDNHSHSELAHPNITRAIENFYKMQDAMQKDLWEMMGKTKRSDGR